MSNLKRCLILAIVLVSIRIVLAATPTSAPTPEKKVALIVGNAAYRSSPLVNPVNDAKDMAARLAKLGFDVILKTDVDLRALSRAITQFGQKLTPGSVALVYYAGHGIQAQGRNFLIPVDAEIGQESSVRSEAIDVDSILEQLAPARVGVVILDACRNNPFERRFRSGSGGGLAQMDAPKGTLIAYATAPGKVAQDGSGRNGLYTAELLKALEHPGRRIEDIFKQVRNNVARSTDDLQIPWESSSLTGDLYLDAPRPSAIASPHIADAGSAFELEYWRSVEKSGKPEDFRAYLDKYPKGQFVDLARSRLKPTEPAAAPRQASGEPPPQPPATVPADKAAVIQAKLEQADALLKAGNTAKAIAHLEKLLEKLPRSSLYYGQTQYILGFAQAAERRCPDALINLRAASANWPDHRRAATAWQTIALCERHLKNHPAARQAAQTLLVRYPDSPEAEHIRQRLDRSRGPAK